MNSETQKIMEEIHKSWKSILSSDSFSRCFDFLSQICVCKPLSKIDFCFDTLELDDVPNQIAEIIKRGINGFCLGPFNSMKKELNDLIEFCSNKYPYNPESLLLKKIARKWLDKIQSSVRDYYEPANIKAQLSPSLDLDIPAEEQKKNDRFGNILLPLSITNLGKFPILDVRLHIFVKGARPGHDRLRKLPDKNEFEIVLNLDMAPAETYITSIRLSMDTDTKINIKIFYKDFLENFRINDRFLDYLKGESVPDKVIDSLRNFEYSEDRKLTFCGRDKFSDFLNSMIGSDETVRDKSLITKYIESLILQPSSYNNVDPYKLPPLSLPIFSQFKDKEINNPYTPGIPIISEWQMKNLMQGKHNEIAKRIMSELKNHRREVHFIRGLTHSGKTSILKDLKYLINKEKNYLPIYIDFYEWWSIISDKKISIDICGLLYELANSAANEANLLDFDTTSVDDYLRQFEKEMRISYNYFKIFIKKLSKVSNGEYHIVFLLDELDWWIRYREDMQDTTHRLVSFMSRLIQEDLCSVVLAIMWSNQAWKRKLEDSKVLLIQKHIEFFEKEDIEKLSRMKVIANKDSLFYTPLSIDFIWRISGGWPGIVQLIFYQIIEKLKRVANSDGIVDISLVRKVVEDIINSEENKPFIAHHLKSLEIFEINFIRKLIEMDLINKKTGEISRLRKNKSEGFLFEDPMSSEIKQKDKDINTILTSLESKQIVEPIGNDCDQFRLRVGLLSYPVVLDTYEGGA
ncbi:MAG: hypothetical protein PVH61_13425 [Candidatus Aminicenantes bacterium]